MMLTILGPTATGKTALAAAVADLADAEIISADSRQVYKGMDLGTGKDYDDYIVKGKTIPYHLIDIQEPGYEYNVYEFKRDFYQAYNKIAASGKRVILCGGTGMYIDAVLGQYRLEKVPVNKVLREELEVKSDEDLVAMLSELRSLHNHTDTNTHERLIRAIEIEQYYAQNSTIEDPAIPSVIVGVELERQIVRDRITTRLHQRLDEGMVDEVQRLLDSGVDSEKLLFYGLEYKYITWYILGQISYDDMVKKLNIAIHQFSKRQMTWFRRMQRKGVVINWVDGMLPLEERAAKTLDIWKKYGDYNEGL